MRDTHIYRNQNPVSSLCFTGYPYYTSSPYVPKNCNQRRRSISTSGTQTRNLNMYSLINSLFFYSYSPYISTPTLHTPTPHLLQPFTFSKLPIAFPETFPIPVFLPYTYFLSLKPDCVFLNFKEKRKEKRREKSPNPHFISVLFFKERKREGKRIRKEHRKEDNKMGGQSEGKK